MKKTIYLLGVASVMMLASCGDSKDAKAEEKDGEKGGESDLCGCLKLKSEYPSKSDAIEKLGEEKVNACVELMQNASKEETQKCE